jgi:hypothetical protein
MVAQLKAAVFNKSVKQNGLGKLLDSWEDFPEIDDCPPVAEDFF